jgi:hypothetical protein
MRILSMLFIIQRYTVSLPLAARAAPPLYPVQPTQRKPAPSNVNGKL